MRNLFLLLLLNLLCAPSFAQKKFIANSNFGIGISTAPWMRSSSYFSEISDFIYPQQTLSPLGITATYQKALTKNLCVTAGLEFRPLKTIVERYETYTYIDDVHWEFNQAHFLKSNLFEVDLGVKYYMKYSPFGFYFIANVNYSVISNNVVRQIVASNSYEKFRKTYSPQNVNTHLFGLEFGLGNTKAISNKLTLDYGLKASLLRFLAHKVETDFSIQPYHNQNIIVSDNINYYNHGFIKSEVFTVYLILGLQKIKYAKN